MRTKYGGIELAEDLLDRGGGVDKRYKREVTYVNFPNHFFPFYKRQISLLFSVTAKRYNIYIYIYTSLVILSFSASGNLRKEGHLLLSIIKTFYILC